MENMYGYHSERCCRWTLFTTVSIPLKSTLALRQCSADLVVYFSVPCRKCSTGTDDVVNEHSNTTNKMFEVVIIGETHRKRIVAKGTYRLSVSICEAPYMIVHFF